MRRILFPLFLVAISACATSSKPAPPLGNGRYVFQQRFTEHPDMAGLQLDVHIQSRRIKVYALKGDEVFPAGLLEEGKLMWHVKTQQWIIGIDEKDRAAEDAGGCSSGPTAVDLEKKIYWTC
jgi:hypothetical protein